MKSLGIEVLVVLIGLATAMLAQTNAQTNAPTHAQMSDTNSVTSQTPAQRSFEELKSLAGSWEGHMTTIPPQAEFEGTPVHVKLRVTSMGNAIMHEMNVTGRKDDPITMFYLDGDQLLLTHYCDAGNRPRMTGKMVGDGKLVDFDFLDVAGSTQYGHMHHAAFTAIDANHHAEEWTFMMPGDKPVRVHFELERAK